MKQKSLFSFFLGSLFVILLNGQTVDIPASKDNTMYESTAPFNFSSSELNKSNGNGDFLFAGRINTNNNGLIRRGLIQFDIAGNIPAGATITNVNLRLYCSQTITIPSVSNANISLHRVQQDWGEGSSNASGQEGGGANAQTNDATWLHTFFDAGTWTQVGGDFLATPSATTNVGNRDLFYNWSGTGMASDVQHWLDNASQNFGWAIIGDETQVATAKRFDTHERFFFDAGTGFSTDPLLSVTYTVAVPVELLNFQANATQKGILVEWATVSEINNEFFTIERSTDQHTFEPLQKISGAGNSSQIIQYEFLDDRPLSGINYYRLKQTDFEGQSEYSKVVAVRFYHKNTPFRLFPNPAKKGIITLEYRESVPALLNILDSTGRTHQSYQFAGPGSLILSDLSPGVYFVQIKTRSGYWVEKLIVVD